MIDSAKEVYRVLAEGRIACVNCDDMLVNSEKFPIVADVTKSFMDASFLRAMNFLTRTAFMNIEKERISGVG